MDQEGLRGQQELGRPDEYQCSSRSHEVVRSGARDGLRRVTIYSVMNQAGDPVFTVRSARRRGHDCGTGGAAPVACTG
jgi:hypothetical protein